MTWIRRVNTAQGPYTHAPFFCFLESKAGGGYRTTTPALRVQFAGWVVFKLKAMLVHSAASPLVSNHTTVWCASPINSYISANFHDVFHASMATGTRSVKRFGNIWRSAVKSDSSLAVATQLSRVCCHGASTPCLYATFASRFLLPSPRSQSQSSQSQYRVMLAALHSDWTRRHHFARQASKSFRPLLSPVFRRKPVFSFFCYRKQKRISSELASISYPSPLGKFEW